MENQFLRTELIYGEEAMKKLASCRVAVFGIGGVGGYAVEALVRSGIGALDLIDHDRVSLTNLNRQIIATRKTLGRYKVDVAAERAAEISPDCVVRTYKTFYLPETEDQFDFREYDYVIDAIDTVTGKLAIIENAKKAGVPVISSMGAGNKVRPSAFEVADLYETSVCPLARIMRRECKKRGIRDLKVVYSKEKAIRPLRDLSGEGETEAPEHVAEGQALDGSGQTTNGSGQAANGSGQIVNGSGQAANGSGLAAERSGQPVKGSVQTTKRAVPGSTAFVPPVAGLIIAGEVINDLVADLTGEM